MNNLLKNYTVASLGASLVIAALIMQWAQSKIFRSPASAQDKTLQIQTLSLDQVGSLKELSNFYVRVTFKNQKTLEFGKGEHWNLKSGESRRMDISIPLAAHITNDELEFKLEIVNTNLFETVVARCSTVSKNISGYNRSYQCHLPNAATPILSYRIGPSDVLAKSAVAAK